MINKIKIFTLLGFLLAFTISCEDVVNIDLNEANQNLVIEAVVTDQLQVQTIKVSKTIAFNAPNKFNGFSKAQVNVVEENGLTYTFTERQPGIYISRIFAGKPGKKYTITVVAENKTYQAVSIMPLLVPLDSLTLTELTFFGNTNKFIQVNYNDPVGIANYYNFEVTVNNKKRNAYYVESDRFTDGKYQTNTIFTDDPELEIGDTVLVDFQCVDENVYRYFFAISQISGNGGPPTSPANPVSNFSNGALGYFSARTSRKKIAVIK